jgi:hypothetical protein
MEMHKIENQSKRQAEDIIWERLCKEEPFVLVVVHDLPYLSASFHIFCKLAENLQLLAELW